MPEIIIACVVAVAAVVTLLLNIMVMRKETKAKKALLLKELVFYIHNNSVLKELIFEIEWGLFKFSHDDIGSQGLSEKERSLTLIVDFFDLVNRFKEQGLLETDDLKNSVGYFAYRLTSDREFNEYLKWLELWFADKCIDPPGRGLKKMAHIVQQGS